MGLHSLTVAKYGVRISLSNLRNQMLKFSTTNVRYGEAKILTDVKIMSEDFKRWRKYLNFLTPDLLEQGRKTPKRDGKKTSGGGIRKDYVYPVRGCEEEEVILESLSGGKGLIVLNRPKQLNTLNTSMVAKIRETLISWTEDKYFIFQKGAGDKAFCAGGDVVAVTKDCSGEVGKKFFKEEYKLDALISCLKVPFASLISGVVMGGGVGISLFGKYRIATETSMFAMPETQIGFFPDVGVSYHLARMPNRLGRFLALTGYRLKGYDLVHAGIATHYCAAADVKALEDALLCDFQRSCCSCPEDIFKEFQDKALQSTKGNPPPFSLEEHLPSINKWFSSCTLDEAMTCIASDKSKFAVETTDVIKKMSPLSLKVTYKQIKEAENLELFECFNVDYRVALKMMKDGDFSEGVRALLIDKDKKPKWKHSDLSRVCTSEVDLFFCPLLPEEELNLPDSLYSPC